MDNIYFETIKIEDGKIFNLNYHIARMRRTVKGCYDELTESYIASLIDIPHKGLFKCKIIYGDVINKIEVTSYFAREIKFLKIVEDNELIYDSKLVDREDINSLYSLRGECDEIIIVQNREVRDTSIANLAFFDGAKWVTPDQPLLEGTMRSKLLEEGRIEKAVINIENLNNYKKVAVMNAMVGFKIIGDLSIVIKT